MHCNRGSREIDHPDRISPRPRSIDDGDIAIGTEQPKELLRPPQSLLMRVRWVFLLVCLIATASTVPHVFEPKTGLPFRAFALVGFVWLVWHWIRGYRRGRFSREWVAIEGWPY